MQKWKVTAGALMAAGVLAGCGSFHLPDENIVSVQKDGSIKQIIVDQFERSYYDVEELSAMAEEKINTFNDGEKKVVLDSVQAKDGKIVVEMTYADNADYEAFNNRTIFVGTVSEAEANGYAIKDATAQDGTEIKEEKLKELGENHIVILQTKEGESLNLQVYNKILYTSGNIISSDKKSAFIGEEGEDMLSYIIFQ